MGSKVAEAIEKKEVGEDVQLSPHFKKSEFNQKHRPLLLTSFEVAPELTVRLEKLRKLAGNKPIKVTSGYRDTAYNIAVGGSKNSQHSQGNVTRAADIQIEGVAPTEVNRLANTLDFGYVEPPEKTPYHTHVDVGPKRGGKK